MCLYTKQLKPLKARKDIVCYKALVENCGPSQEMTIGGKRYRVNEVTLDSPYQNFTWEVGKLYSTKLRWIQASIYASHKGNVHDGFHAYTSLRTLKKQEPGKRFVECIIPKGSTYYLGSNNGSSPGIVGSDMKITKLL